MRTKPRVIPIIADIPTAELQLGSKRYAEGIAAAVLGGEPARYTIGLYGPWGSGKSSLLLGIAQELREHGTRSGQHPVVVEFDAWRYSAAGGLMVPLLLAVRNAVEAASKSNATEHWRKVTKALRALISNIDVSFMGVGVSMSTRTPGEAGADAYYLPFEKLRALATEMDEGSERIVVLIDDLDRCTPKAIVDVLEAIHVLTDVTGIVFVLALDYGYLIDAISEKYKDQRIDPDRYIEKLVQVPFHIPRTEIQSENIPQLVPKFDELRREGWFDDDTQESLGAIVRYGLRSNTRQLKRLLNTALLAKYTSWDEPLSPTMILKVFGLQIAWPSRFGDLFKDLERTAYEAQEQQAELPRALGDLDEYNQLLTARDSGGVDLSEYMKRVLTPDLPVKDVLATMRLAQEVAESPPATSVPVDDAPRGRTSFEVALAASSQELRAQYEELKELADSLPDSATTPTSTYLSCSVRSAGPGRSKRTFASIVLRPSKDQLMVYLGLDPAQHVARSNGNLRDVAGIGHWGVGDLEVTVKADDLASLAIAKQLMQESHAATASVGLAS